MFPTILGVSTAEYKLSPGLWAYCPDATDKILVGGDGGAKQVAGQCQNETSIIHLQGIASGDSAPSGWTAMTPRSFIPGFTIYFRLTSR